MWTTLAVLAALGTAPAADGDSLKLANVRLTYGIHGPARASAELLPGDNLCLAYLIEGITTDANGKVSYSTAMEITDKAGKVIFRQDPKPLEGVNSLGGRQMAGFAHLDIGLESKPGDHVVKVTIKDLATGESASLTQPFKILNKTFGLIRLTTTSDSEGRNPTAVPGVGESLWINFGVTAFARDMGNQQPHVTFQMQIFDDNGKPTTAKPFTGEISDKVPAMAPAVYGQFLLSLNRPGKFRVEIKASCEVSKKSADLSFPLTVVAPK